MKFIKVPRCRVCFPKNMTTANLRKRIYDTTNGEYELVGEFVDQKTKIKVLHTTCGRITEYSPRYFHNGAVCPACNNYFNNKWEKMYAILVKYKAEIGNTNIPKRATYKGFNLGSWCQKQRRDKRNGKLNKNRVNKLDVIDFDWEPLGTKWYRKYELYKRYINNDTGEKNISRRTDFEGEHIGVWVELHLKLLKIGKMSEKRKKLLLEVNPHIFD